MYAIVSPDQIELPAGTVVRILGTWQDYRCLCDRRGNHSLPRIKYYQGEVLLMSPLPRHGREANIVADVVKALLDSQNRNYEAFTPITLTLANQGGIEPDYCFYIDHWQAARGKNRIDWEREPPPDLVIEIDVSSYTAVADYVPFAIPEVWLYQNNRLQIYQLEAGVYQLQGMSRYFPGMDVASLLVRVFESCATVGTGKALQNLRQQLGQSWDDQ